MFNPFAPLTLPLLRAFVKAGRVHFVRQQFCRDACAAGETRKGGFMFTHYREAGHTQHHYGAISHDPYKKMYDWANAADRERLLAAAAEPAGYRIYSCLFLPQWQKQITPAMRQQVRQFIGSQLHWKPSGSRAVGFEIYATYGELYARLTFGTMEARVKLEDIERRF